MKINNALLSSLNPCEDRHKNYLSHYSDREFTIDEFLDLENISYDDKIWVSRRLLTAVQARTFAILCAESVLPIFEAQYPKNKAPRKLLNYLKAINWSDVSQKQWDKIYELRANADAAASAADADDASAAYAAAHAAYAASAAYASAAYASAYAASASAANAADAYAAAYKGQQDLNLTYLEMAFSLRST